LVLSEVQIKENGLEEV